MHIYIFILDILILILQLNIQSLLPQGTGSFAPRLLLLLSVVHPTITIVYCIIICPKDLRSTTTLSSNIIF